MMNMQWDSMFSVVCLAAALSLSPLLSARWKRLNETFILSSVCSTELLYVTRTGQIGLPAAVLCRRFFNEPQLTRQRHQNPADTQRPAGIYRAEPRLRSSGPLSPFTRRKALSSSGDKVPIAGLCVCVFVPVWSCFMFIMQVVNDKSFREGAALKLLLFRLKRFGFEYWDEV